MFRDEPVHYPYDNPVFGRFLGIAINVGPAMNAKLLKHNKEVVYWSTFCGLTDEEVANHAHIKLWEEFDEAIGQKFGADCTPEDFPDIALEDTPHYKKINNVNVDLCHQDKEWLD